MNPLLNAFSVPRLLSYIESLQASSNDRKISLKKRFKARRDLLDAQENLKNNLASLIGSPDNMELWGLQHGLRVRVLSIGSIGTICTSIPNPTKGKLMIQIDRIPDKIFAYAPSELEIILPPGIWATPH